MTSGQREIGFGEEAAAAAVEATVLLDALEAPPRVRVRVQTEEAEAHAARLAALEKKAGRCLWRELEAEAG